MTNGSNEYWDKGALPDLCHSLFESMRDGAFVQVASGRLLKVNNAMLNILGIAREDFLSRDSNSPEWDVIDETRMPLKGAVHPSMLALTTGQAVKDKVLAVRNVQTRRYTWLEVNAIPQFRNDEKMPFAVIVTLHDITREKNANDILAARLKLLEFSRNHSLEELLMATLDELEVLTGSKVGFYHFLESDQKTLSLQAWSTATVKDYCTAEGKGRHYDIEQAGVWVDCVRQQRPVIHNDYASLKHRHGLPEGHAALIRDLAVPVFRSGLIVAILGVGNKPTDYNEEDVEVVSLLADLAWDIAEVRQAQQLQQKNEARLGAIFNLAGVALGVTDLTGRFLDCNQKFLDIMGYSREELLAMNNEDVTHPEDMKPTQAHMIDLLKGRTESYRFEKRYITKYGSEVWIDLSVTPIRDEDGNIHSLLGAGSEITARKEAELNLKLKMAELERFNDLTVGREMVMIELKKEINALLLKTGASEKYRIVE